MNSKSVDREDKSEGQRWKNISLQDVLFLIKTKENQQNVIRDRNATATRELGRASDFVPLISIFES
jgi:hypothetical protein